MNKAVSYIRSLVYAVRPFENMQHMAMTIAGISFGAYSAGILVIDSEIILGMIAVFAFLSHVLSFNNYATYEEDMQDASKGFSTKFRLTGKIFQFRVSLVFFLITVGITLYISPIITVIAILLMLAWALYTHPAVMLKKGRFMPFILDFITMPLLFLFGFYLTGSITLNALIISLFFGMIETGGHLNHMVIDSDIDKKTGILTVAVRFGMKRVFLVSMLFLITAPIYFFIATLDILPLIMALVFIPGIPLLIIRALPAIRGQFSRQRSVALRSIYRTVYIIETLILEIFILLSISYKIAL
ncbi:MAG: UbiA family prenyltransferase [bacterium]